VLLKNESSDNLNPNRPVKTDHEISFWFDKKRQKQLWQILKWLIFAANIAYLYFTVGKEDNLIQLLQQVKDTFGQQKPFFYKLIFLCGFLLVFANWGLEAYKWKILVRKFQRISFRRCFAAVLCGSAVSLWIPNRAGEYLGRILFIRPGVRIKGVLATLVGSFAQLSITLILGIGGGLYYAYKHWPENVFWLVVPVLSVGFVALLLFFYFNINKVRYLLPKKSFVSRFRKYLVVYSFYSFADLGKVLSFSLLRYFVFSGQFVLFLWFFGGAVPPIECWLAIFLIYLVQTIIPANALTELGIRGASSVFFLQGFVPNTAAILSASYGLWLINLLLPGIFGLLILVFAEPKLIAGKKR
jgi:MFS family permease